MYFQIGDCCCEETQVTITACDYPLPSLMSCEWQDVLTGYFGASTTDIVIPLTHTASLSANPSLAGWESNDYADDGSWIYLGEGVISELDCDVYCHVQIREDLFLESALCCTGRLTVIGRWRTRTGGSGGGSTVVSDGALLGSTYGPSQDCTTGAWTCGVFSQNSLSGFVIYDYLKSGVLTCGQAFVSTPCSPYAGPWIIIQ